MKKLFSLKKLTGLMLVFVLAFSAFAMNAIAAAPAGGGAVTGDPVENSEVWIPLYGVSKVTITMATYAKLSSVLAETDFVGAHLQANTAAADLAIIDSITSGSSTAETAENGSVEVVLQALKPGNVVVKLTGEISAPSSTFTDFPFTIHIVPAFSIVSTYPKDDGASLDVPGWTNTDGVFTPTAALESSNPVAVARTGISFDSDTLQLSTTEEFNVTSAGYSIDKGVNWLALPGVSDDKKTIDFSSVLTKDVASLWVADNLAKNETSGKFEPKVADWTAMTVVYDLGSITTAKAPSAKVFYTASGWVPLVDSAKSHTATNQTNLINKYELAYSEDGKDIAADLNSDGTTLDNDAFGTAEAPIWAAFDATTSMASAKVPVLAGTAVKPLPESNKVAKYSYLLRAKATLSTTGNIILPSKPAKLTVSSSTPAPKLKLDLKKGTFKPVVGMTWNIGNIAAATGIGAGTNAFTTATAKQTTPLAKGDLKLKGIDITAINDDDGTGAITTTTADGYVLIAQVAALKDGKKPASAIAAIIVPKTTAAITAEDITGGLNETTHKFKLAKGYEAYNSAKSKWGSMPKLEKTTDVKIRTKGKAKVNAKGLTLVNVTNKVTGETLSSITGSSAYLYPAVDAEQLASAVTSYNFTVDQRVVKKEATETKAATYFKNAITAVAVSTPAA